MKTVIATLSLMLLTTLAFSQEAQTPVAPSAGKDLAVATIQVPTIQCSMCVKTITKALSGVEGVKDAAVDLDGKTTTVTFDSKKTDVKKLERVIANAGYDANETKRDPKAYEQLSPCCKMDE